MKFSSCTWSALLGVAFALVDIQDRAPVPGVVAIPFQRSAPIRKRGSFVNVDFGATYFDYIINITVGTPPQPITLSLDTGSRDIILVSKETSFCLTNAGYCPQTGYYNANKSSTYKYLNSNFSAQFGFPAQGQGSGAAGDFALENFQLGGTELKNQQFDIAYGNATILFSILGLSYTGGANKYDNFPISLAKSGATNLAAFSLWKDTVAMKSGQVLFGGVDTTKYSGNLTTLDTQTRIGYSSIIAFDVLLNGVALSGSSSFPPGSTGSVLHVLDCGTSYSLLPDLWLKPIYDQFNVTYFVANDTAYVDCGLFNTKYTVDYTFKDLTITVPISSLVNLASINPNRCSFGLVPAGDRIALLGDNFLSSAYTVFDITNNQISIAARDFSSTQDSIVALPSGGVKALKSTVSGTTLAPTGTPAPTGTGTGSAPAATTSAGKKSGAGRVLVEGFGVLGSVGLGLILMI